MSTPARPSTPVGQTPVSTPKTGTWRHPKMDEIVRRQNASSFTDRNVRSILYNAGSMATLFAVMRSLWNAFPSFFHDGHPIQPYTNYFLGAIHLVFLYNIAMACRPLLRPKDDMSDIPLTPAQRKLLGLPPSSAPPTPGSQYVTPPRYARTPTPLSGSPAANSTYTGSPLAGRGSPLSGSISGSPFSPGTSSPLLQRAMGGVSNGSRRHSYGSPSSLGPAGSRLSTTEAPSTPTPSSKGNGVGLNNKWLYDKGRRNSGSAQLYA